MALVLSELGRHARSYFLDHTLKFMSVTRAIFPDYDFTTKGGFPHIRFSSDGIYAQLQFRCKTRGSSLSFECFGRGGEGVGRLKKFPSEHSYQFFSASEGSYESKAYTNTTRRYTTSNRNISTTHSLQAQDTHFEKFGLTHMP